MSQGIGFSQLTLQKKILVLMVGITLGVVLPTLYIVYTFTGKAITNTLQNDLKKTQTVFENYQILRNQELTAESRLIGEIPSLKALISTKDHATILGFASNFQNRIGADLILITDEAGRTLASTDERLASRNLAAEEVIKQAFTGREMTGTLTVEATLFQVRTTSIRVGESPIGTITIGFKIDDDLAHTIKNMTDSEISFIIDNKIVATTWTGNNRTLLIELVPTLEDQIRSVFRQNKSSDPFDIDMGGQYLSVLTPLSTESSTHGVYLIQRSRDEVAQFLTSIRNAIFMVSVLIIIIAFWISYLTAKQMSKPITALVEGSMAMAEGDLSTTVANTNRDEIGILAQAFNAMSRKLRDLISQVRNNTLAVNNAAEQITDSTNSVVSEIRQQEKAVDETSASILEMSSSIREVSQNVESLSDTATDTSSSMLEMDASSSEIANHMDELSGSIDVCSSTISEMSAGVREIAENLETLSSSTEETSSSLGEFNNSVQQVERNAKESSVLSDTTVQKAQEGVHSVQQTIEGMEAIKASFMELQETISRLSGQSNAIGKVVRVITEITGQTNLLSLNAAIIAAQAGEHGKGFSIVAEEIKNLADRTAISTREISNLIKGVQGDTANAVNAMQQGSEKVKRGVALSNEAGQVLKVIIDSSQRSTQMVTAIVNATQEQGRNIGQVNKAMSQVKDLVLQINRSIREQDAAGTQVMHSIDNIRVLGLKVKGSTQEQSKTSRSISTAMRKVTEMIREILVATNEQTRGNERIQGTLEVFRKATGANTERASELTDIVDMLTIQSKKLKQEIGRFHL